MTILIAVVSICVTAVAIGLIYLRAVSEAKKSEEHRDLLTYMAAKDKAAAEADTQSKALQLYSMQSMLATITAQAEAQSRAQEQTTFALSQAVESMKENRETAEALELLRWKAIERSYLALTDKKKDRYWEEVNWND